MRQAVARRVEDLIRFLAPIRFVVRSFYALHTRRLGWVATLGIVGSVLNAAGYLALVPLIDHATGGGQTLAVGAWQAQAGPLEFVVLIAIVVALVIAALQVNYRVHCLSLDILRRTVTEAAVRGLAALDRVTVPFKYQQGVNEAAGSAAFACGIVMRQVAMGLSELLQLCVFVAVLLWLHPGLTLAFMVTALGAGLLYARSVGSVARAVANNKDLSRSSRQELAELATLLEDGELDEAALRGRIEHLHETGAVGGLLESKLDIRRQMRRGPMLIEYLFPIALIVLPLVALATGSLRELAGPIVVYVLVLRNVIGLLQKLASLLISAGRFYPPLLCYVDLQTRPSEPRCQFTSMAARQDADDDAEDD